MNKKNLEVIQAIGEQVKVIFYDKEKDSEYVHKRRYVKKFIGKVGVIVDVSNAHGLCYGIIFPERKEYLKVYWFEPNEVVLF
jgi:hypothetical protein